MDPTPVRLILVEDSEDDAYLVIRELQRGGFSVEFSRVQTAARLEEALSQGPWSAALVDYRMPLFNGLEAIQTIRKSHSDLPIIIVSGKIGEEVAVDAMRAGAHDYVMKDNLARLAPAVRRELEDASNRTAKRAAEEALRDSEARYRAIVEDQTELVCRWRPDGLLTFANRAFCEYFEISRTRAVGSRLFDLVAEEDRPTMLARIERLTPDHPVATGELRFKLPESGIAWHEWTDRATFDSEARITALQSVGRDVTERKQADEAERQRLLLVEVLRDTAAALNSTLELDGVLDRILANVGWVIPHDAAAIFSVAKGKAQLLRMRGWADKGIENMPDSVSLSSLELSALGAMAESGKPIVIQNTAEDPRWRVRSRRLHWARSFAAAPLFDEEKAFGVMALFCERANYFTGDHLELLEGFASQAATAARNARLFQTVSQSQEELRWLSSKVVGVLEEERGRIARELHDEVGQVLTALTINAEYVARALGSSEDDPIQLRLQDISTLARQTMEQIRDLSLRLRPAMLDELGLEATLSWLTSSFAERGEIAVEIATSGLTNRRFHSDTETTLYRAVQEALTNVSRHADASRVKITLEATDNEMSLRVQDNGRGFAVESTGPVGRTHGLGILGMRERVNSIGGNFRLDSSPRSGTVIEIRVPVARDDD